MDLVNKKTNEPKVRCTHNRPKKVNQEEFYEVEAIVGKRKLKAKKLEYKVKWVGYQESEATW